jgi:hypothetical protein
MESYIETSPSCMNVNCEGMPVIVALGYKVKSCWRRVIARHKGKTRAERAGFDPSLFSGHSLRAGFLTSAAKRGASVFKMMASSRHRSIETLAAYVRDQELFQDHAGAGLL